ncbi:hypothetical protein [Limnohabitans sp. DM1]|uniref:hypothetical protein n=1 Tax=Limnohabitans sp. DM1 TaxID=1597955 RepID=UPI000B7CE711|nr:hypothetical protein [Limnohabitans sp. DM1]
MQTINLDTAKQLAEELVAKTRQIKLLEAEVDQLKLEIFDAAKGGIQCAGGRVIFVDSGTSFQLDRNLLNARLVQQFGLSEPDAASFVDECKSEIAKTAYISVHLE